MDQNQPDPTIFKGRTLFCPECDYNLTGLPGGRCPECGHSFTLRCLNAWADSTPTPITVPRLTVWLLTPGLLVWAAASGSYIPNLLSLPFFLLAMLCLLGGWLYAFIAAIHLARRVAVTYAVREGGQRSGRHDYGRIAIWATAFLVLELVLIYSTLDLLLPILDGLGHL